MKLIKFVNCDAPSVSVDALEVSQEQQQMRVFTGSDSGRRLAKSWRLLDSNSSTTGCYWLLNDDGTPIGPINDVLLATRLDDHDSTDVHVPSGIDEGHVNGVDLRSKVGKKLQRNREEYGQTFKTAAKNAALLMDAERLKSQRAERMEVERKRLVESIENGEEVSRRTRMKNDTNNKASSRVSKVKNGS